MYALIKPRPIRTSSRLGRVTLSAIAQDYFRLNLEKKMAAPISILTSSTIDGCDFYNPL